MKLNESGYAEAIEAASQLYSKDLTCVNINSFKIPLAPRLEKLKGKSGHDFKIRRSHGMLHAISAADLIDNVYNFYARVEPVIIAETMSTLASKYGITIDELLMLVKIATLFHDSGRQGDGVDLWDNDSAENCGKFLKDKSITENEQLITLATDLIKYKDNSEQFVKKHGNDHDILRQLINTADTIEVIRCRDKFYPDYIPFFSHDLSDENKLAFLNEIVIPQRLKIFEQGRLQRKGNIEFKHFKDDRSNITKIGYDAEKLTKAYEDLCQRFPGKIALLSILNEDGKLDNNNVKLLIEKTLRGLNTYLESIKTTDNKSVYPHTKGLFKEYQYTMYYVNFLENKHHNDKDKLNAIKELLVEYASDVISSENRNLLFSTSSIRVIHYSYPKIQNEVLRSIGHYNKSIIREEIEKTCPLEKKDDKKFSPSHIHNATHRGNYIYDKLESQLNLLKKNIGDDSLTIYVYDDSQNHEDNNLFKIYANFLTLDKSPKIISLLNEFGDFSNIGAKELKEFAIKHKQIFKDELNSLRNIEIAKSAAYAVMTSSVITASVIALSIPALAITITGAVLTAPVFAAVALVGALLTLAIAAGNIYTIYRNISETSDIKKLIDGLSPDANNPPATSNTNDEKNETIEAPLSWILN